MPSLTVTLFVDNPCTLVSQSVPQRSSISRWRHVGARGLIGIWTCHAVDRFPPLVCSSSGPPHRGSVPCDDDIMGTSGQKGLDTVKKPWTGGTQRQSKLERCLTEEQHLAMTTFGYQRSDWNLDMLRC